MNVSGIDLAKSVAAFLGTTSVDAEQVDRFLHGNEGVLEVLANKKLVRSWGGTMRFSLAECIDKANNVESIQGMHRRIKVLPHHTVLIELEATRKEEDHNS